MRFPTQTLADLRLRMNSHTGIQILLPVDEENNSWEVIYTFQGHLLDPSFGGNDFHH